jgi:glucose-6-phosphate isomerase
MMLAGVFPQASMTTAQELWQRYQERLYHHPGLGFFLDTSRIDYDDAVVQHLAPLLQRAFRDMQALESGAIANPDEQRMVGHYWLRNPALAPTPAIRADLEQDIVQIQEFARKIQSGLLGSPAGERFTDILSIGIGGSALGPQFVATALAPSPAPLRIHFFDNSDPAGFERVLSEIGDRLSTTLVIVISKSGSTPEPHNGMTVAKAAFSHKGLAFAPQAVAITMAGSKLDQQANSEGWLARFPMYDWVGGRTSELSAVGLVPAALLGIAIDKMLEGAKQMDEATRVDDLHRNPAAQLALCWHFCSEGSGKKDMVVLPYKDSLLLFSRYLQQLVMESLGKRLDLDGNVVHQGLAVYGNKGSTDQHAYVQQLRDGVLNFFVTFIEVLEDQQGPAIELEPNVTCGDYLSGFLQGTRTALYEQGRQSITVSIPRVDERSVGALIALYERTVGFYASMVNVNAYDQPGVEAGKKAAAEVLSLQQQVLTALQSAGRPLNLEELAAKAGTPEQIERIYWIARHLAANQRLTLAGDTGIPQSLKISLR